MGTRWPRPRPASQSWRAAPPRRSWRSRTAPGRSTACCSTRRWSTPSTAPICCGPSRSTSAAAAATGRWPRSSTRRSARIRAEVGEGRVVCGLSGGVDSTVAALLVHKAIGDRLTCIFVDNGLLRENEAVQVEDRFRNRMKLPLVRGRCGRALHQSAGRRHRSGDQAQDHRRRVHRRLRGHRQGHRRVRLPGPGHAVSRRDRERLGGRPGGADQEPSQRRRPAGADALQADRAAAPAVQGRGARGRHVARARRGLRLAAAVPGARAGGAMLGEITEPRLALLRRGRRGGRRTKSARPAGIVGSGSRSRCCCRCRASA